MKCNIDQNIRKYHKFYETYFNSWKYENENENENEENERKEQIPELAPGKTILFISRNHDSSNLFHGISEFINDLSIIIYLI